MRWAWRRRLRGVAIAVVLVFAACSEKVAVGPEGRFSWEPQSQMVWPVEGAIVSPFGDAARPGHRGIDLAARPGEPVAAAAFGRAEFVGAAPGYGYVVILSHGENLSTVYAHLGSVRVREGETVSRGQTIGRVAAGGYLHYEIRRGKEAVDPATFYAVAPQPLIGGSVYVKQNIAAEPVGFGAPPPVEAPSGSPSATPGVAGGPALDVSPAPRRAPPSRTARSIAPTRDTTPREPVSAASAEALVETPPPPPTPRAAPPPAPSPPRSVEAARSSSPARAPAATSPPAAAPPSTKPAAQPPPETERAETAETGSGEGGGSVGMGAAVLGANLVYMPAKFAYAGVGLVTGSMVLLLAHDVSVANDVWTPTLGGNYVVTERHLRGEAPLHFLGGR